MGIGSSLMVKLQEEEIREKEFENIIKEAAYYVVVDELSRETAFNKAKELNKLRKDSQIQIDNGECIEYLDDNLNEPIVPKEKENQVNAVAKELYEKFEYER